MTKLITVLKEPPYLLGAPSNIRFQMFLLSRAFSRDAFAKCAQGVFERFIVDQ